MGAVRSRIVPATTSEPVKTEPFISERLSDRSPSSGRVPPQSGKQQQFDQYWETRDLSSADLRTRLRIGVVESLMTRRRGRLLDVGCGRGAVASNFAERGYKVTATDISPLAVRWTGRQHPAIQALLMDLEVDDIAGEFETIVCLEVLQQVRGPVAVLKKLKAARSDQGDLIVSLPNEFHLARRLAILFGRVNFGGIDDTHIKLYSVTEHRRLFAACGLQVSASRAQSIVPPRWLGGRLHTLGNKLAKLWPCLFALSVVYRLRETRG